MSDIEVLHQMIKTSAKLSSADHYGRKMVNLIEPQHPDSSVSIFGLPDDAVVIKVDAFRSPDTVFNGSQGECKRADYVIVADAGAKSVIVYIEMKATKGSEREVIQQLTGARCFVAYCREVGKAFWNQPAFLDEYQERFVSVGHTSIPKRKTRISKQPGVHDHPSRMLKIDYPHHLQFDHLAGANT